MQLKTSLSESLKSVALPTYADANGNITDYLQFQVSNFTFQVSVVARYEYSPFGQVTFQSGEMAEEFAYKFSTKYWDEETGLYQFNYRYYHPEEGRFLGRDPMYERGPCVDIYTFVVNNSINQWDLLGLETSPTPVPINGWNNLEDIQNYYLNSLPLGLQLPTTIKAGDLIDFDAVSSTTPLESLLRVGMWSQQGLSLSGYPEASEHFGYWLNPTGKKKPELSKEFLTQYLKSDLDELRKDAAIVCADEARKSHPFGTQKKDKRAYYVIGDYIVYTELKKESGNKVKLKFTFDDDYDFHINKPADIMFGGLDISIPDAVWLELKNRNKGYGVDFNRKTEWTEVVECCASPTPPSPPSGPGGR